MQTVAGSGYDMFSPGNRFSPQNTQVHYPPLANQQSLSMMMPASSSETWIDGNVHTYQAGLQPSNIISHAVLQNSAIAIQQPRVHQVTVQKNVQVPKTVMVNLNPLSSTQNCPKSHTHRCKSRKKSQPQSPSTSMRVQKTVTVPKTIEVEREIRIPVPVKQKRTVTVPRTKTIMESVEVAYEVPATEEVRQIVQVPRSITTMETVQVPETTYLHEQPGYVQEHQTYVHEQPGYVQEHQTYVHEQPIYQQQAQYTQHVGYVQPAVATAVTEAVNPVSTTLVHGYSGYQPGTYTAPTTYTSSGSYAVGGTATYPAASSVVSAAHNYMPAHPTVGMFTSAAPTYTTGGTTYSTTGTAAATGYTNNYVAAPLLNAGGTSYTNNYVVAGGSTAEHSSSAPTLYGTDPGVQQRHGTA